MSIFVGSRYQTALVGRVPDASGSLNKSAFRSPPTDLPVTYTQYTVQSGDRLDLLAHKFYGDVSLWWAIADANPEVLLPEPLTPGISLRIPHGAILR